jgi:hypothetical protein
MRNTVELVNNSRTSELYKIETYELPTLTSLHFGPLRDKADNKAQSQHYDP